MSLHFDQLFGKKLQGVAQFVKKDEISSIWPKLCNFSNNYHVFGFRSTFHGKVAKSASFREKARKIIDLAKTFNFSSKLPCLCIFMNFSARSCKKCLIPWKKHEKSSIWPKLCNFFGQTTMSLHFDQLFGKKLQKVAQFVKKDEISSIWPKLCNFSNNYHVFGFRSTFHGKVAKSASFREKARKIIDLAKTFNFSSKLPCLCIFMNFSARSCKKCLIPWKKHEKSSISPKLCNFFEKTSMSLHFDQLFGKKLQKVAQFVKKDEISSIWPKLCNFSNNYHVFGFRSTFQEKVAKSASFRKKARKIIDLAKSL